MLDFIGHMLTLILTALILISAVILITALFLYTYWSWFDPVKLRAVEAKRIQYWPFLFGGRQYRERRIAEIHTETWLKLNRAAFTFGTIAFIIFMTVALLQVSTLSK